MIINGTIRDIKVKRTRNLVRGTVDIKCSDYRLEGKFKPYERIEDFFWKIFYSEIGRPPQPLPAHAGAACIA